MELFKCVECGHLFERGEEKSWIESHGESMKGCPICEGTYEEAKPCKVCGCYENVENDICKGCKDRLSKDVKKFIKNYKEEEKEIIMDILEEII